MSLETDAESGGPEGVTVRLKVPDEESNAGPGGVGPCFVAVTDSA